MAARRKRGKSSKRVNPKKRIGDALKLLNSVKASPLLIPKKTTRKKARKRGKRRAKSVAYERSTVDEF